MMYQPLKSATRSRLYARVIQLSKRTKVTVSPRSKTKDETVITSKTRNVGIMAHIDAGKTTTTERMLYFSGVIEHPGEVHHGDTVTDFLPQERERGITIQSAVVSFPWNDITINLIDTPGHVDFTFEVQRSLRVVDSAVTILDSSAGVEAQTLTVWRQASDYNLPRLVYLNKMDKSTGSLAMSCNSVFRKLKTTPIILQEPLYTKSVRDTSSGLSGVIDLIEKKKIMYDMHSKGVKFTIADMSEDKVINHKRCNLVEQVADLDSDLAAKVIESESTADITSQELHAAIKRVTLSNQAVPVLLGSSYKNIGVQPLMDAICRYLPHPMENDSKDLVVKQFGSELCSLIFKVMHDPQLGTLTFIRVFRGSISTGQKVYNITRGKSEKILKLYMPLADDLREVEQLVAGQVGIVSGLKETFTGDTVTSSSSVASSVEKRLQKLNNSSDGAKPCLTGVNIPESVFFCSVEPASISQQKSLDAALLCLQREDPSLRVHTDPDTGQTVLSGMGELHLEVIHERLKSDFKVDSDLGKVQVAYKETIMSPICKRIDFERSFSEQKQRVSIELVVRPTKNVGQLLKKGTSKEAQENLAHIREKNLNSIKNGVISGLRCGPKLGFPVINVEVILNFFDISRGTSDTIIEAATATCIRNCLEESHLVILEPFVNLEVTVDENYQKKVIDDLFRRRFQLEIVDQKHGNKVITGKAPLNELLGYSTAIRTVSSGLGTFSMQFDSYEPVTNPQEEKKIYEQIRGF